MRRYFECLFAALFVALLVSVGPVAAQDRFALVIANSKYRSVVPLPNPARDAVAVEGFLKTAGFDVTLAKDLDREGLSDTIAAFANSVSDKGPDSVALVFFAGHGLQVDGNNYLLPVDAKISREGDIPLEGMLLADIMSTLERIPSRTRIVMLDACRNNPFEKAKVARGLAIVSAPPGTIVAYSTSPGTAAEDGRGDNSPFVLALIKAASRPGASVEAALKDTRIAVHRATSGRQIPWEVSSLVAPFSFLPGGSGSSSENSAAETRDEAAWRKELETRSAGEAAEIVIREDKVVVYQVFLALFPDAPFAANFRTVLERRLEMWAWFEAVTIDTAQAYEAFLARYPSSDLAAAARRLAERARQRSALARRSGPRGLGLLTSATGGAQTLAAANTVPVPTVRTVIKEVRVPSPPRIITKVKEVPVVKTVVKEVRVPGPTKVVTKVVKVPGPTKVVTKVVKVPGPTRVVKKIVRVPGPTRIVTRVVRVPRPCHCSGGRGGFRGGFGGGFRGHRGRR